MICALISSPPFSSGDNLGILGHDFALVVILAVENRFCLCVVLEFERHLAVAAFEALLMEDLPSCFLLLLGVHSLGAYLTFITAAEFRSHILVFLEIDLGVHKYRISKFI